MATATQTLIKLLKILTIMGNLITNLPTISLDAVLGSNSSNQAKKPVASGFDAKNYLNVRLEEGETSKKIVIRLLPMDLETMSAFVFVHTHNVKVPREVSKSGYKSYLCLSKNQDIDHEKYGHKCPFCELNRNAYQESTNESDPTKKAMLQKISVDNLSRESVIVRCIERGKEDEGVKFWKFNTRLDKTDPYNTIKELCKQRAEEGAAAGVVTNILDTINGFDLIVTINEGTAAPTITDAKFSTPLSKDENQMREWIYDEKKWQDVFTPKPYEYLSLVSQQKIPWYDKSNNVWVDKEEYENGVESNRAYAENNVKAAEDAITGSTVQTKTVDIASMTINDSGLPW